MTIFYFFPYIFLTFFIASDGTALLIYWLVMIFLASYISRPCLSLPIFSIFRDTILLCSWLFFWLSCYYAECYHYISLQATTNQIYIVLSQD